MIPGAEALPSYRHAMSRREPAPTGTGSATKQWSIPSKLTLGMVPIAVVALLLGVFLVWNLVSSDPTPGFSGVDVLALMVAVVVSVVAFGSLFVAYRMGRSMSRRMGAVSDAANRMARKDMVDLLDALRTSEPDPRVIAPPSLDTDSADEIGDLARSFQGLHGSLIEVGARQMESLRAGVSNILVTLARRNSSLVDRQLAVLDELEAREDDPETLGGYYQVDHLAARMRRNAESLLVLAGSESPRVWAKAAEMSDVVRAAVSEVDEYQRVEVLALEPARLSGGAVTDIAHLLAELLENAVQFSPPTEAVRVTGLFGVDGYEVSISDKGMGLSDSRVSELNRILERPPSLGLSVEPTMGIYVVAKLAHRHGLTVRLIRSVPGITAKAAIPRDLLELVPAQTDSTSAHRPEDMFEPVEVIDLTQPAMTEPEAVPETAPVAETAPEALPVRVPGEAFGDDDPSPSVVAGVGAATIKSALVDYDRGRRAADEQGEAATPGEEER